MAAQGFPRADVDLYRARALRQEHICLTNDHKALVSELHAAISELHQAAQRAGTASEGTKAAPPAAAEAPGPVPATGAPFAVINRVEDGSPAQAAGLREGDQVLRVGDIHGGSAGGVHAVAARLAVRLTCLCHNQGI